MAADLPRRGRAVRTPECALKPVNWELVLANGQLLKNVAGNVLRTLPASAGVCHADLVDAGMLGLIDASRRFDESRGFKFSTFARYRIQGSIFDWLRRSDRDRAVIPIDELNPNVLAIEELETEERPGHAWLWRLVKRLPERTQRIFELYYGEEDLNDAEIGSRLGLTASRIGQIRKGALARLRRSLRKEPLAA